MPRNGSGVYGPPPGITAVPGTTIESADFNSFVSDAGQALTDSGNVQGTAPWQANQAMGGFKHTNLGAGSAANDGTNLGQVQGNIVAHATAVGGTVDAVTATFTPAFAAYTDKMRFRFTASGANTVVAPTINVDGLGLKTFKKLNSVALAVGDIGGAGHVCDCVYNGTDVILLNPALAAGDRANTFTEKQTFSGPVVHSQTTLTDAATVVWDLSTGGPDYKVTITSNRTLGAFTGGTAGQEGLLTIAQDGIGGWSFNLGNAVYDFWGPSIENIARGANEETVYEYKVISAGSMFLRRKGATSIGGPGRDLLAVTAASASATIDFVLTKWLSLYDRLEIDYDDVVSASDNVALNMRVSTNGGSSYDAGATDYQWVWQRYHASVDAAALTGDDHIELVSTNGSLGLSNVAGEGASGTITIHSPANAQRTKITWTTTHIPSSIAGSTVVRLIGVAVRVATQDTDAIRLLCSSGNITSGNFRLYGIRK